MITAKQPVAIIPARGGSKRFPKKNIALLKGKPLIAYAIEAALESDIFDTVCVSSEDEEILQIASRYGAQTVLKRPERLAADAATLKELCAYLIDQFFEDGITYQEFALLLPTNPLRKSVDILEAYQLFKKTDANFCMSLVAFSHPPQRAVGVANGYVVPYWGKEYMTQTQLLEPLYRHDGSIIIGKTAAFKKENNYYGEKVVPYFVPSHRSVDIDHPLDLVWAEFLMDKFR